METLSNVFFILFINAYNLVDLGFETFNTILKMNFC